MEKESIHKYFEGLLTLEQVKKLSTPRVLAYFKKHRGLEHTGKNKNIDGEVYFRNNQAIIENEASTEYFNAIRKILNEREHVD